MRKKYLILKKLNIIAFIQCALFKCVKAKDNMSLTFFVLKYEGGNENEELFFYI